MLKDSMNPKYKWHVQQCVMLLPRVSAPVKKAAMVGFDDLCGA